MLLVDAQAAAYYTGRPVGTIWRWASEGRIGRHGGQYDLDTLPMAERDEWSGDIIAPGQAPPLPAAARAA